MASTYEQIASTTLSSSTSSAVTFSNIPQNFTDIVAVRSGNVVASNSFIRLNGVTAAKYSVRTLSNYGGAVTPRGSAANTDTWMFCEDIGPGTTMFNIMNYSNTNAFKTVLYRGGSISCNFIAVGLFFDSTAAISSLSFIPASSYAAGSTFSLYGIKAA